MRVAVNVALTISRRSTRGARGRLSLRRAPRSSTSRVMCRGRRPIQPDLLERTEVSVSHDCTDEYPTYQFTQVGAVIGSRKAFRPSSLHTCFGSSQTSRRSVCAVCAFVGIELGEKHFSLSSYPQSSAASSSSVRCYLMSRGMQKMVRSREARPTQSRYPRRTTESFNRVSTHVPMSTANALTFVQHSDRRDQGVGSMADARMVRIRRQFLGMRAHDTGLNVSR